MNKSLKIYFLTFFIIILIHIWLLTKLIFFPYPEFFINPYLVNHGLKPYQQIMDQHAPGFMFFPINFNNLGMTSVEASRIWLIGIIVISQILLFLISKKIFKDYKKALIVNFLYLVWQPFFEGTTFWIDSILPIFLLPAFYFLHSYITDAKRSKKTLILLGFFMGLASIFKQVSIPLAFILMLYIFWFDRKVKTLVDFLIGFLPPIFLTLLYFSKIGVLKDLWYWTIVFNLTTFAIYGKKSAPFIAYYYRVAFVFCIPLIVLFFKINRTIILTLIFLVGSLVGAFARFDFVHFQPALPFAMIGTVFIFDSIYKKKYLFLAIIFYLLVTAWWLLIFYKGHISSKVILSGKEEYELSSKIQKYTKPGEKIFILGAPLHLYQMTQTMPAGDIFYIQAPWYLMIAQDQTLQGLKRDDPKVVVEDRSLIFEGNKLIDYASKLDKYIQENYKQIDNVGNSSIMFKK